MKVENMIRREQVLEYVNQTYDTKPEHPFKKYPSFCAFKHQHNRKWYGLLMNVGREKLGLEGEGEVQVINVKLNPEIIGILIDHRRFLPAYHMNKEYWLSINLDEITDFKEVSQLIDDSFNLTAKR
jgi:predicted DNA-binding protein (MmcQ/YjbR family)